MKRMFSLAASFLVLAAAMTIAIVHGQQTDPRLAEIGHDDATGYPATVTSGAGIGTGTTVACATLESCNDKYGTVVITTATTAGSASAVYGNIAFNEAYLTKAPNCVWAGTSVVGGVITPTQTIFYMIPHDGASPYNSLDIKNAATVPANSTTFTLTYHCGK